MTTADITLKRFRSDATRRFDSNQPPFASSHDTATVRAASLLLGANLRGWLSTREKEYLDSLATDNALAFLILGDRCLHPSELDFIPPALLGDTPPHEGDAVYSRRCDLSHGAGRVFTARIGSIADEPLVLGMCAPDHPTDNCVLEQRFAQVLEAFRAADRSVRLVLDALRAAPPDSARIVVNRASGRILHVDPTLCAAIDKEPFDFVSREYGSVEPLLNRLVRRYRMKMENLAGGCLHVACLTFTPATVSLTAPVRLNTSLVDHLLGEVSDLTTAADYLHEHSADLPPDESAGLAGRIARTGEAITRRLTRYRLLANFDRLPVEPVNLIHSIERAADRFTRLGDHGIKITGQLDDNAVLRTAPRDAHALLFETVLELHRAIPGRIGATTVDLAADNGAVHISIATQAPRTLRLADLESLRLHEIERLAARLGSTVQRRLQLDSNSVLTRIIIPTQESQA